MYSTKDRESRDTLGKNWFDVTIQIIINIWKCIMTFFLDINQDTDHAAGNILDCLTTNINTFFSAVSFHAPWTH